MHDTNLDTHQWPTCTNCTRQLRNDELSRLACQRCQTRTDTHLAALPALWRDLDTRTPTRGGVPTLTRGAARAHSPVPLNLTALDLIDEIPAVLAAWVDDWASQGYADSTAHTVITAVRTLRFNLDQAATAHPAFPDFAREIARLHRACEHATGTQPAERAVPVACPCGAVLHVTVTTARANCHGCGTQYGRREVLNLPLAARAAA